VIDPTKVVRTALQNAASVASLMLTTESDAHRQSRTGAAAPAPGPVSESWRGERSSSSLGRRTREVARSRGKRRLRTSTSSRSCRSPRTDSAGTPRGLFAIDTEMRRASLSARASGDRRPG
jgi:hypothetical protein